MTKSMYSISDPRRKQAAAFVAESDAERLLKILQARRALPMNPRGYKEACRLLGARREDLVYAIALLVQSGRVYLGKAQYVDDDEFPFVLDYSGIESGDTIVGVLEPPYILRLGTAGLVRIPVVPLAEGEVASFLRRILGDSSVELAA